MPNARLYLQPSIKQLLAAEALSEAQVLTRADQLDRPVLQVVFGFASARAGSLVVSRAEALGSQENLANLKELAGVVAIKPASVPPPAISAVGGMTVSGTVTAATSTEVEIDRIVRVFNEHGVPLIVVPAFGDASQVAEDIRIAFQSEIKKAAARLHTYFVATVIENGISGLVEELANLINRPVAIETADFKVLAAQNMGPTPPSQQKTLTEEVAEELNREMRSNVDGNSTVIPEQPVRIGRRLVTPVMLEGVVVGYVSLMVRPSDDLQTLSEYLAPAALAALVDFSSRRKEVSTFSVTQKSLLKDLLSGRSLSAGDQERLEQHYGFDLCDGFWVLVVQVLPPDNPRDATWPPESVAMVEMETTRVFVYPYDAKAPKTWQQYAEDLQRSIKKGNANIKLQFGASRMATSLLDLPDAYREARQALIIGSMTAGNEDKEFSVGYAELGVKRLLYLMIDHPELDTFYQENLEPLVAYDEEWEAELVPTLRVYLEQGANLNSAAKELFIHRHTMRYRLEQIAELLNVDIDSTEVLLNLQIAFLIRDMKGKPKH